MLKNKKSIKAMLATTIFMLSNKIVVLAADPIESHTSSEVATKSKKLVTSVLEGFGGAVIIAGILMIGIQLVINAKRPDQRADSMGALMSTGIGIAIMGGAALIGGFFYGLGAH